MRSTDQKLPACLTQLGQLVGVSDTVTRNWVRRGVLEFERDMTRHFKTGRLLLSARDLVRLVVVAGLNSCGFKDRRVLRGAREEVDAAFQFADKHGEEAILVITRKNFCGGSAPRGKAPRFENAAVIPLSDIEKQYRQTLALIKDPESCRKQVARVSNKQRPRLEVAAA